MKAPILLGGSEKNFRQFMGGKASQLLRLSELGLNVPKWFVISSSYLDNLLSSEDHPRRLNFITDYEFDEDFKNLIHKELSFFKSDSLAVRSSAHSEDLSESSFAGMYESYLNVKKENIFIAIKNVWMSAYSERVRAYKINLGLESENNSIAIIIQEMINADVSGVAFGIHPITKDPSVKVVNATWGLGEGIVSGELVPDEFLIRQSGIKSKIRSKKEAMRFGANGINKTVVADSLVGIPCLEKKDLDFLEKTLSQLKKATGLYQDVEFCLKDNVFYFLQSRPVTALKKFTLWDNNNLIESYPGVTTPLTFSFVQKTYERGYRQISEILGIIPDEKNTKVFSSLIGFHHNRLYYNLTSIHELLNYSPLKKILKKAFHQAIGINDPEIFEKKSRTDDGLILKIPVVLMRLMLEFFSLKKSRREFLVKLDGIIEKTRNKNFSEINAEQMLLEYQFLQEKVFSLWRPPVINGIMTMIFFKLYHALAEKLDVSKEYPNLHNDLLVGLNNIVSTEPVEEIIRLVEIIKNDQILVDIFKFPEEEILKKIKGHPFSFEVERYLFYYGDRCKGGELKLENPSYWQRPQLFIEVLKSYLMQKNQLSFHLNDGVEKRKKAERMLSEQFKFRPFTRLLFSFLLLTVREQITWRENLRYKRSQAFGLVKLIFSHLENKFFELNLIEEKKDFYFLHLEEVLDKKAWSPVRFRELIRNRKKSFEINQKRDLPQRIVTLGEEDPEIIPFEEDEEGRTSDDPSVFFGDRCSSGIVVGRVRVLFSAEEANEMNGDILVTTSTDPGWVKLFPTAGGIIVERGSLLSHTGIVSREMGIPCIVGARSALKRLKTGDEIEMNGGTGMIRILSSKEGST